uniref:Myb-like domain-containing protein n=1 Tax=Brassica oleracea var. oleracea TaxID=109376 RepID=A0A0D3BAP1_BRAOL
MVLKFLYPNNRNQTGTKPKTERIPEYPKNKYSLSNISAPKSPNENKIAYAKQVRLHEASSIHRSKDQWFRGEEKLLCSRSVHRGDKVPVYGTPHSFGSDSVVERKERRKWTPTNDILLISFWLNTSKYPVVGNEQRSGAFRKRIAANFLASQKAEGSEPREPMHCKQRWQKINDLVCKFCGSYEAATREKTSGQNETDVLKKAHEIFYNNHQKKFNLEHCDLSSSKHEGISRKRKVADAGQLTTCDATEADECTSRPPGVKADKAHGERLYMGQKHVYLFVVQIVSGRVTERCHRGRFDTPTYPENLYRRRFRMNKRLFMHIVDRLSNEVHFLRQKKDGLGRLGLSTLQKCIGVIRVLAYGSALDAVDEYLRLGATTARLCVENFVEAIINFFGDEYLRRPTPDDLQRLLYIGELCEFPRMIGSINCMHWEWKNCPTA